MASQQRQVPASQAAEARTFVHIGRGANGGSAGDLVQRTQSIQLPVASSLKQPSTQPSVKPGEGRQFRTLGSNGAAYPGVGGTLPRATTMTIASPAVAGTSSSSTSTPSGSFVQTLPSGMMPTIVVTPPNVRGPVEQKDWSALEFNLYRQSEGAYNPTEMAFRRRVAQTGVMTGRGTGVATEIKGLVSIVAPTMATRQGYHENLWRCFDAQTWPNKELVVLETYETEPSSFLRQKAKVDKRITHVTIKRSAGKDFTVGLKRNMTLHLASGEYIVNFDDDDLYAPSYVDSIVGNMQKQGLIGITLSAWYNYYTGKGVCTFSDPSGWSEWVNDEEELDKILYGYGFSYTHKRAPSLIHPYPNVGFAEDAPFFLKLKELYGEKKVILWRDITGLCMHIMHRANTAQVLGTQNVSAEEIAGLAVTELKPFQKMIDSDFFRFSPWRPPVRVPALSACIEPAEEAEDRRTRLRGSTFDGSFDNSSVTDSPQRPRADTFRN